MQKMRDISQEDPREIHASKWNLNYVSLEGNIGCMVNGAGLAMGIMDVIKLHGGAPANFLDVGGSVTRERVIEAFKIILSDKNIMAILISIFGGIVRCDLIADGIIEAMRTISINVPVIIRLEGNNSKLGYEKLINSGLKINIVNSLNEAAKEAIKAAKV